MELMFAISILGIGLIAIASIFPVASLIQRETVNTLISQQVTDNVKITLRTRGIRITDLRQNGIDNNDLEVNRGGRTVPILAAFPPAMLGHAGNSSNQNVYWSIADRSFPTVVEDPLQRPFSWVPMILKDNSTWKLYIFVLRNGNDLDFKRFGSRNDWANYEDGKTTIFGNTIYRVPGIKRFAITEIDVDTNNNNSTFTIPSSRGAIQIGSILVTDTGKILTVNFVSGNNLEEIRVGGRFTSDEVRELTRGYVWTGVAPPSATSGSSASIDMPNPLIDVVVVGSEAFKP